MINGEFSKLKESDFSGILNIGGTILGTSRQPFKEMKTQDENGESRLDQMLKNYRKNKLDLLVTLGGAGTHKTASLLSDAGCNVIGLPKTIDNDIWGTDVTFGFHTALEIDTECIDRISSIKITIYRLAHNSKIVSALLKARENGKEVVAVMELCARFDEENNLDNAELLQEAGCTVFYGVEDLKVHSKIISITLEEGDKVSYITHIGTGNYNEGTAKQYTDLNIITANDEIGRDGASFFRSIAILDINHDYSRLLVALYSLKKGLLDEMDKEIAKGREGVIRAKINSLTDRECIEKLIEASKAGVKVSLVVTGICCLLPGVEGESENITVISIVGRFLEHSRIYSFGKEGEERVYIASADLMTRNFEKRIEIAAPVLDSGVKKRVLSLLSLIESDNVKARRLTSKEKYEKIRAFSKMINSQEVHQER